MRHTANSGRKAPLRAECLQPRAPLHRTVVIPHAIARRNHVAARQSDRDQILQLARDNGRVDLVERAHAFGHGPRRHERESADRAPQHLDVEAARRLRGTNALHRVCVRAVRIAFLEQRERPRTAFQPGAFDARGLLLEQPARALQPAVRHGALTAERPAVGREPHRHTCGAELIAGRKKETIGALARVEHDVAEIEPPRGEAQSFERVSRLALAERRLERVASLRPRAARQRRLAARDGRRRAARAHDQRGYR